MIAAFAMLGIWFAVDQGRPGTDRRPVALPSDFAGVQRSGTTFPGGDWDTMAAKELGPAPFAGAPYYQRGGTYINVTAARTDLQGQLDLRMAGDEGRPYGQSRCTDRVVMPVTHESLGQGRLLCWRTSSRLSITALVMIRPPTPEAVGAAVDGLWEQLA